MIIAVVVQAIWALARTAVKGWLLAAIGALVLGLYAAGVNEIVLLLGAGVLVMAARNAGRLRQRPRALALVPMLGAPALSTAGAAAVDPVSLFFVFLKIGAVLYGSGYVLLAFLRNDFVVRLGWLTDQQLIDAVAVGQLTPGRSSRPRPSSATSWREPAARRSPRSRSSCRRSCSSRSCIRSCPASAARRG